ncbi:coactosin-like protein [Amphiura filiformis]|uniref:coactosin-like protein n=1 Tax=Amphiura filiformis TaxID=82378 RepID=UPI003B21AE5D
MTNIINKEEMRAAYDEVRKDDSDITWAVFIYNDDNKITTGETGIEYDEMLNQFADDARVFAYVRLITGDEMSKRAKFAFITWIGTSVSAMKRAKVSTDKAFVKQVMPEYGKEFLADDKSDVAKDVVLAELGKAGGANYGSAR